MPNHPHLIVRGDPDRERSKLSHLLSGFTRHSGERRLWDDRTSAERIPDPAHLSRQIRYVHLNPCRARLVDDPLRWPWSTHRGVIGAEADPWADAGRLAEVLGRSRPGFEERFHAYVSGDPTVAVSGTPLPAPAPSRRLPAVPLEAIVRAAVSATVWQRPSRMRHAIVLLAVDQGWRDPPLLAAAIGRGTRRVRSLAARPDPALLARAKLCLGDERLRIDAARLDPLLAVLRMPRPSEDPRAHDRPCLTENPSWQVP
jgi:hypothetical protein